MLGVPSLAQQTIIVMMRGRKTRGADCVCGQDEVWELGTSGAT
jgi:hypothetical protein